MASPWSRAKRALAVKLCISVPSGAAIEDSPPPAVSAAVTPAAAPAAALGEVVVAEKGKGLAASSLAASGRRLSSSVSRNSKRTCAICLGGMKSGHGQALFTAECSHKFHFHCISSNVKHGNYICPVCRAEWKELPFQGTLPADANHGRARVNPVNWPQDDGQMAVVRRIARVDSVNAFRTPEVSFFNDDEPINLPTEIANEVQTGALGTLEIKTHSEFPAIQQGLSKEDFGILIHLKAPHSNIESVDPASSRAPLDLVTVLDVSGSMAGTKIALVKRAMGFVIQNLGPNDRLSVIAFSSSARRLFPLRQMSESGRQQALQAVNSLVASGGTNIADGLKKGAKVIEDRRLKNPVCSIILLSDGQDTYTVSPHGGVQPNYSSLVPSSILPGTGHPVQIHAFGFGADHDSAAMHSIAEISSGTFSFIEAEGSIQDAFAQCIGGLLSVVVQEMRLGIECVHQDVQLSSIKSGSYASEMAVDGRTGSVEVGDLYADEERDFLVTTNVPPASGEIVLLKLNCSYKDTVTSETVQLQGNEVSIQRPEFPVDATISLEVERERNRIQATEGMSAARAAAERGSLSEAVSILEECRRMLAESQAGRSADNQCMALDAELREMQERMESRQRYEASGRAYVLAGLSSHSWQRATARGDSTELTSLVHSYQTPLMVDMLQRSQTLVPSPRAARRPIRPSKSFSEQLA